MHGILMLPNQPEFARCQTQGTALTNVGNMLFHRGEDDVSKSCLNSSCPAFWLCWDSLASAFLGFSSSHLLLSNSSSPGGVLACRQCQWLYLQGTRTLIVICRLLVTKPAAPLHLSQSSCIITGEKEELCRCLWAAQRRKNRTQLHSLQQRLQAGSGK